VVLRRDRLWVGFLVLGCLASACFVLRVLPGPAFLFVGGSSILAWALGPRLHGTPRRRPWRLLTASGLFFFSGIVVRGPTLGPSIHVAHLGDLLTLCGFAFLIGGLVSFLSGWGLDRHALLDGLIVGIGAAVASTLIFVLPALSIEGRPLVVSVISGLYPLLDIVLVLLVANLAFTTTARPPALLLLGLMMLMIFVGDLAYSIYGRTGKVDGPALMALPFLLAFVLGGTAALHPTSKTLAQAAPQPVQAWSLSRMLLIGPAVAVPFLLTVLLGYETLLSRWILGLGGAAVVALLLLRASAAVRSNAAAQHRFEHQATHDPLTDLPNRRLLAIMVERLLEDPDGRAPGDVWMFYLDLDGFKLVNDSWGHPAGDRLIIDVGARLRQALPAAATVARIGGDEFVVVQRGTEPEAMDNARRIMECVERPLRIVTVEGGTAEVVVGASMGIVRADRQGSAEALMRDADTAMYRAKEQGRNRWTVFDASMRDAVRAAVAQEQLSIAYQPIVAMIGGRPAGCEALVRWEHPVRGWIGPNMFIAVAEDSNLISALGAWVLRESVGQLAAWRAARVVDADFWMSVNVSPRQLNDGAFADRLDATLRQAGVPAANLVLEITESVMVEGGELTERVLRELRSMGVRISVDDFGTGFSALGYLRRHPVTGVKIDRSFVNGLGTSTEDEEIVRAVVAMSSALNLTVVAEGVETAAQRDVLVTLGVPLAQGWLWGKAVPAAEFATVWSVADTVRQRVGEPVVARSD